MTVPPNRDGSARVLDVTDAQSDWFVREVIRLREIGFPIGCCDNWPECSHVLAWVDEREDGRTP